MSRLGNGHGAFCCGGLRMVPTNNLATQYRTHHCPSELGYLGQIEELSPGAMEASVVHREGL